MLDQENKLYLIALNHIGSLKNNDIITLVNLFNNSPKDIFSNNASSIAGLTGLPYVKARQIAEEFNTALKKAEKQFDYALKNKFEIVSYLDETYPSKLLECPDFPPYLFYKGNNIFNGKKYLSVVGTRKASDYGKSICKNFIRELSNKITDLCIVSGLAYGIDICAHTTALECGIPTLAVMAGGLSYIYPKEHKTIAEKIYEEGAVLSEFDFEEPYFKTNFLKRNRIIAGFSDATVVVESAFRGGSLSTANMANSYNRDVFAFPGRAGDIESEGCNKLIRDNKAALISGAEDFLYFVPWTSNEQKKYAPTNKKEENKQYTQIISILNEKEKLLYDIIKKEKNCHKDSLLLIYPKAEELNSILLNLELKGVIKALPGNFFEGACLDPK